MMLGARPPLVSSLMCAHASYPVIVNWLISMPIRKMYLQAHGSLQHTETATFTAQPAWLFTVDNQAHTGPAPSLT